MKVDFIVVIAYVLGLIVLFMLGRLFLMPMKVVMKLVYNAILGGIALLLINLVGGLFGLHIAINVVSALVAGFLGLPGIVLLVVLKYLFNAP